MRSPSVPQAFGLGMYLGARRGSDRSYNLITIRAPIILGEPILNGSSPHLTGDASSIGTRDNLVRAYASVTICAWCVTLQVSLLRNNILAASRTLQKKYASCVSSGFSTNLH